jgi:hypothetical protein
MDARIAYHDRTSAPEQNNVSLAPFLLSFFFPFFPLWPLSSGPFPLSFLLSKQTSAGRDAKGDKGKQEPLRR